MNRSDLVEGNLCWLLTLTWGGVDYRFSSRPVCPVDADGISYPFDGRLEDIDYEEGLEILTTSPELRTVAVSVIFPIDVAERIQAGYDLGCAVGELALWVEGTSYEARRVLLVGQVVEPEYGALNEPVSFSLEENPFDDLSTLPEAGAMVTRQTWTGGVPGYVFPVGYFFDPDSDGLYYPIVYGKPGYYRDDTGTVAICPGSPGIPVDRGSHYADLLVIAGHPVVAGLVNVFDSDGLHESFFVFHLSDDLGREVAAVDLTAAVTITRTSKTFWVAWPAEAMAGTSGAGELLRVCLRASTLRVDWGRVEVVVQALNRYQVGAYIDTPVSIWEWAQDNLLPLLPISMTSGPDGIYPVLWRYDAKASDAVERLVAGPGVVRLSRVTYDRQKRDVVNEIRMAFVVDANSGHSIRRVIHTPKPNAADSSQVTSLYAQVSGSRYGFISKEIVGDIIWEDDTARMLALMMVRTKGFLTRIVEYEVEKDRSWLRGGNVLLLTDDEIHLSEQVCLLRDIALSDGERIKMTLLILEDPPRDQP